MKINLNERTKVLICILLLFSITLVIFQYSVEIREPWFGELSSDHHQWLTGSTIEYSKNWYFEGPLTLKFTMLDNPKSVEFPMLSSREPYLSYPPGAIIPIYIISEVVRHPPTPAMVMSYNLLNHFLIAFFLSLIIFFFLRRQLRFDLLNSFLFSVIPIILELLLPAPLYWHQNVFFTDQAVILPFTVYIFLEVLLDGFKSTVKNKSKIKVLKVLQNIIFFYGFLTDWLFVFIGLTVYIKRVIEGSIPLSREMFLNRRLSVFIKESIKYWFAPLIVVFLFVIQVLSLGETGKVVSKALFRAGMSSSGASYLNHGLNIFVGYITDGYGHIAVGLIAASLAFFILTLLYLSLGRFKKHENLDKIKKTVYLIGMLLIPCIIQVLVFRNHSVIHDFSTLKFSIPLVTVPFVLLPIMIFLFFEKPLKNALNKLKPLEKFNKSNLSLLILFLLVFAAASFYTINEFPHYKEMFPTSNNTFELVGTSLQENTGYNDIVFSPDFQILEVPPQQLSYSMKRVYQIDSMNDIKEEVKNVKGNYNVVIMFLKPPSNYWVQTLQNIKPIEDHGIYYYKLNSTTFSNLTT
jgi:hypothetical protein